MISLTSLNTNFTQLAKLTITGLPTGVTSNFTPEQITAGATSTLSLVVAGTAAAGSYPFTVTATALADGVTLTKTTAGTLTIQNNAGQTTLAGRVLNTDNEPVIGATVSTDGKTATSDAAGAFTLAGVTAGTDRVIMVDGRTASAPGRTYPVITEPANIIAGQANQVPYTFYLPNVDTQYEVTVIPNQITNVTTPRVNGLQMIIPANANLRNRDGSPVTRVSITPVPIDRTPAPLPANVTIPLVYTSQPGGAIADIEMPVIYPNLLGLNPNTQVPLYNFNHDTVQWYIYGYGRVSSDGRTIVPEVNPATGRQYGLTGFSWHSPGAGPTGAAAAPDGNPNANDACGGMWGKLASYFPVDYTTGVKIEKMTDIAFGGTRGGLSLSRTYTSDLARISVLGRFGRGTRDNFSSSLVGNWQVNGAGRVITPEQVSGILFSYTKTEADGTLVFSTTQRRALLSDVVRKLPNGTFEYRVEEGTVYRFNATGRLSQMVDTNGNATTLTYSGNNLTQVTDAVGRPINIEYNADNFIKKATDPLGRSWQYTYDNITRDSLLTVTDPLGRVLSYEYDGLKQLTRVTDPLGNLVKEIIYNSAGRVVEQRFADLSSQRYEYVLSGTLVTSTIITDALGRQGVKRFTGTGAQIAQTDTLGQVGLIERTIDTKLPTKTTGPCGCPEIERKYDAQGNVTEAKNVSGQTTKFEFEPTFNNLTKTTDRMGRITNMQYDLRGNMTKVIDPLGQETNFAHNGFGQLTNITNALNQTAEFRYDNYGFTSQIIDPLGHTSSVEIDIVGRLKKTTDPLGRSSTIEYDAGDRVKKITNTAGVITTYEYDNNNNLLSTTDALGRT